MPVTLHHQSQAEHGIFEDLQTIIRVGFHRFRRKQITVIQQAAGFPQDATERVVCGAIRTLIKEQVGLIPTEEWEMFASRLFGLTADTAHQSAGMREQLAGEGLNKPRQPSTVRSRGGLREAIVIMLADQIRVWADHHNPGWRGTPSSFF